MTTYKVEFLDTDSNVIGTTLVELSAQPVNLSAGDCALDDKILNQAELLRAADFRMTETG